MYSKVDIGLRCCSADDSDCKLCPYMGKSTTKTDCATLLMRDALQLVECQEIKIGILQVENRALIDARIRASKRKDKKKGKRNERNSL